jgi:hypothetical protein
MLESMFEHKRNLQANRAVIEQQILHNKQAKDHK